MCPAIDEGMEFTERSTQAPLTVRLQNLATRATMLALLHLTSGVWKKNVFV